MLEIFVFVAALVVGQVIGGLIMWKLMMTMYLKPKNMKKLMKTYVDLIKEVSEDDEFLGL